MLNKGVSKATRKSSLALLTSCVAALFAATFLVSCDPLSGSSTEGPPFERPEIALSGFNPDGGIYGKNDTIIDVSGANLGFVGASGIASERLNFQISAGDMSYHYELPPDGTPIICPLNMGSGTYVFTIWKNTSGNKYVEYASPVASEVVLENDFVPFLRPSYYCIYNADSACVQFSNELNATAENQGDVVRNVYTWVAENITYDYDKAAVLAGASGYIPNPDSTLETGTGICFDFSALAAAMLRSQGIPCTVTTGYVSPDNIYHAWNMIYIDGSWKTVRIEINTQTWTLIDTTFASTGSGGTIGDGVSYTERYTY